MTALSVSLNRVITHPLFTPDLQLMHMKRFFLPALIVFAFAVSAFSQSSVKIGSAAPAFTGTYLDGAPFDLDRLRGSVVVLTFWSTRCTICHVERPKLNTLAAGYGGKEVVFLALSMENEEKIGAYLRRNPFKFEVLPNSFGTVLKYADRTRSGNLDMGFPAHFVVDQHGTVRYKGSGYDKTQALDDAISVLVGK